MSRNGQHKREPDTGVSECVEIFQAMRERRKYLRAKYGVGCPSCVKQFPKAQPKILLPQEYCRQHRYTDPRPESIMDSEFLSREAQP
jgi:hypothetical protein